MRAVIQRVSRAHVSVAGKIVGSIDVGLLVLLGIAVGDAEADAAWIANRVHAMRIFPDSAGTMDLSIAEVGGSILMVSQFTLHGDVRKGRRPSYITAARPEVAEPLVERVVELLRIAGATVETGVFGAMMEVELVNHGPVTLIIDSPAPKTRA